jgi:hypothetical protein
MTRASKLKDKMLSGANSPDKFAAAEQAMAAGGLVPAAMTTVLGLVEPPSGQPVPASRQKGKKPAGDGQAVRESLTLLPEESQVIDAVRLRLAAVGVIPNRSEVIRAGILALRDMNGEDLTKLLGGVPKLKPGRPT